MCGIAGYVRHPNTPHDPRMNIVFMLMGVFMQTRGTDSWGFTDGKEIFKEVGELQETFTPRFYDREQAAIHTRHGTRGEKTAENSHPFLINGIIGMHNGMIYNDRELDKEFPDRKVNVDSEHIFWHISEKRDLSELEGYGVVVYWVNGLTHIGKFNRGDLTIVTTPFGIIYCSCAWAIRDAMNLAGYPQDEVKFYDPKEGALYTIHDGALWCEDSNFLNISAWVAPTRGAIQPTWDYLNPTTGNGPFPQTNGTTNSPTTGSTTVDTSRCRWCKMPLSSSPSVWDTPQGMLCEDCSNCYYDTDFEDDPTLPGTLTTAREHEPEYHMVECHLCTNVMVSDDRVWITNDTQDTLCDKCFKEEFREELDDIVTGQYVEDDELQDDLELTPAQQRHLDAMYQNMNGAGPTNEELDEIEWQAQADLAWEQRESQRLEEKFNQLSA